MFRQALIQIAIFLLPFAAYGLFLRLAGRREEGWPLSRVLVLVIAGLVLTIASFLVLSHFGLAPEGRTYVPAHVDAQGNFVPGGFR
jgi:multisubunit Na+/H+ antiporter MnhB subunit